MDTATLFYFLLASVLLTLAPGPDIMYLLAKSLADGARNGIALAAGLSSGILFHTTLVILGVAALIQGSPVALAALKYLGALYLLYLAVGAFRDKSDLKLESAGPSENRLALYRRGNPYERAESEGSALLPDVPAAICPRRHGKRRQANRAPRPSVCRAGIPDFFRRSFLRGTAAPPPVPQERNRTYPQYHAGRRPSLHRRIAVSIIRLLLYFPRHMYYIIKAHFIPRPFL